MYHYIFKIVLNPPLVNIVETDFFGDTALGVEVRLVPVDDTSVVIVKDLEIKACIEKSK